MNQKFNAIYHSLTGQIQQFYRMIKFRGNFGPFFFNRICVLTWINGEFIVVVFCFCIHVWLTFIVHRTIQMSINLIIGHFANYHHHHHHHSIEHSMQRMYQSEHAGSRLWAFDLFLNDFHISSHMSPRCLLVLRMILCQSIYKTPTGRINTQENIVYDRMHSAMHDYMNIMILCRFRMRMAISGTLDSFFEICVLCAVFALLVIHSHSNC